MRKAVYVLAGAIVLVAVVFWSVANRDVDTGDLQEEIDNLQTGAEHYGCNEDEGAILGSENGNEDGIECVPLDEFYARTQD